MRNSARRTFEFIPNLPSLKTEDIGACVSFMFYDSEKEINGDWIPWLESLFLKFDCEPDRIIFQRKGKTRRGKYMALRESLLASIKSSEIDFQIRSVKKNGLNDFFPSEMSISINTAGPGKAQGVISVVEEKVPNISDFSKNLASQLFQLTGNFYGHSSRFPIVLGPDAYAAGVGVIPKGWSFMSTKVYTQRLTTWRKKTQNLNNISVSFREIFPVNFLKESHLENRVSGKEARLFYEMYGSIVEVFPNSKQYMWIVEVDKLKLLRKIFEKKGLVLSSL